MTNGDDRQRFANNAFLQDFMAGMSYPEMAAKYALTEDQLLRAVDKLKQKGLIPPDMAVDRQADEHPRATGTDPTDEPRPEKKQAVDLNTGLVLHCPSCGAPVERDSGKCLYCKAPLDFSKKGKISPCPSCFADIPADAVFCVRCGLPVKGQVKQGALLDDRLCPRCRQAMLGTKAGDFSLMHCDECGGFFVPNDTFEMMQEGSRRVIIPTGNLPKQPLAVDDTIRYVQCPVCSKMMNRRNFAGISGVIIDTCRDHGIWFDAEELAKVMDFIAKGGMKKADDRQTAELRAKKQKDRIAAIPIGESRPTYEEREYAVDLVDAITWIYRLFKH